MNRLIDRAQRGLSIALVSIIAFVSVGVSLIAQSINPIRRNQSFTRAKLSSILFTFLLFSHAAWGGINVAAQANGGVASASSTYSAAYTVQAINNGDRKGLNWGNGGGWNDATSGVFPDWVQINFSGIQSIGEIDVFTIQDNYTSPVDPTLALTFTQYGITDFNVQYWDGAAWVTVPGGSVTGNNNVWRSFTFPAVSTDRIRVTVNNALASYSRVAEIEAYTAASGSNVPPTVSLTAPTNGATYTAPAAITLSANAADSDGTIAKVEFYNGGTLLGTATTSPYTLALTGVAAGTYTYTAKAYDNLGASTVSATVNVTVTISPLTINTSSLPGGTVGSSYTQTLLVSGGTSPYTWSLPAGSLPAGLSLNSSTGVISGTPSVAGSNSFTVKVTDASSGSATQALALSVSAAANIPPSITSLTATPQTLLDTATSQLQVVANDPDNGPAPLSYSWSIVSGGGSLSSTTIANPIYTPALVTATTSVTINVAVSDGAATVNQSITLTVNHAPAPLVLSTTSLPNGAVGSTYSQTLAASGGTPPYTWSVTTGTLSAGLTLNTTTGEISGTPSVAGSSSFTIKVTDASSASDSHSITLTVTSAGAGGPYNYTYDEVGRLIAMTDSAGNAVQYDYDSLGNLIAIKRPGASSVSIIDFTPDTGAGGTGVTITGTGFSATPSLNTVSFNGLGTTVNSATPNQLVVSAPVGVTSGPISVTTPLGSATSGTSFLVGALLGAPTITSFAPTIGVAGTTVTVAGTNFDTGLGNTKVRFNQTPTYTSSVTSTTSLSTVVPANATSGKIRVATLGGYVDSAADFIIPPSGIAAGDIVDIQRILVGGTQNLNITPANKVGLLLFDGSNAYMTLNITAFTTVPAASPVNYQIYAPTGILVASGSVFDFDLTIYLHRLTQNGTYSIYFQPGAATATLSMALVADPSLALDGTPSNITLPMAGYPRRLMFNGSAGQNLGLGITGLTLSPNSSTYAQVYVNLPDGFRQYSTTCYTSDLGCEVNLSNLPENGTYSVLVTPAANGTGAFTATLSTQKEGSLLLDSAPSNVSITRAGQTARLTFTASAGQNLSLGILGSPTSSTNAQVYVYKADGNLLSGTTCYNLDCKMTLSNLPVSGTYSVLVTPLSAGIGSFSSTLSSDVTGSLTASTSFNLSMSRAGQNGRLSFNGAVGDIFSLALTGVTLTPSGSGTISVFSPNGILLTYFSFTNGNTPTQTLPPLPMAGTYTILIEPNTASTVNMTLLLTPALQVALTLDGAASNVTLALAGQAAQLTFTGSAGQNLGLGITGLTLNPVNSTYADVSVYRPDGRLYYFKTCYTSWTGCEINLSNLPMNGIYNVAVTPTASGTGSFTATLSSDVTGTLTAGTAFNLSLSRTGQNGRLTFGGNVGTSPTLTFSAISTNPAGKSVTFNVSSDVFSYSTSTSNGGLTMSLYSLPATGTYTLFVDPSYGATATLSVTLSP